MDFASLSQINLKRAEGMQNLSKYQRLGAEFTYTERHIRRKAITAFTFPVSRSIIARIF